MRGSSSGAVLWSTSASWQRPWTRGGVHPDAEGRPEGGRADAVAAVAPAASASLTLRREAADAAAVAAPADALLPPAFRASRRRCARARCACPRPCLRGEHAGGDDGDEERDVDERGEHRRHEEVTRLAGSASAAGRRTQSRRVPRGPSRRAPACRPRSLAELRRRRYTPPGNSAQRTSTLRRRRSSPQQAPQGASAPPRRARTEHRDCVSINTRREHTPLGSRRPIEGARRAWNSVTRLTGVERRPRVVRAQTSARPTMAKRKSVSSSSSRTNLIMKPRASPCRMTASTPRMRAIRTRTRQPPRDRDEAHRVARSCAPPPACTASVAATEPRSKRCHTRTPRPAAADHVGGRRPLCHPESRPRRGRRRLLLKLGRRAALCRARAHASRSCGPLRDGALAEARRRSKQAPGAAERRAPLEAASA